MMWRNWLFFLVFFTQSFQGFCEPLYVGADYSIVFVHIGAQLPPYVETALSQARAFNQDCPIILIANHEAVKKNTFRDPNANITIISCESLVKTREHQRFIKATGLDDIWRNGFWRYTSERFLYLNDLMAQYGLVNVFHLENDNMLYVNLEELLPIFKDKYQGIAATFDNDQRCIPGFVFIPNAQVMGRLAQCFASHARKNHNDMEILVKFKNESGKDAIDNLPIIMAEYCNEHLLVSAQGHNAKNSSKYHQNIKLFQSIFDAAAIGQYLGGIDPREGAIGPGFINESCVFNTSLLTYEWLTDKLGRKVPYAVYANQKYRINNLHIHSKRLEPFLSL